MTSTARTEPGNRIRTTCSCGNEFTVPPSQRGEYVRCLSCNEETLALEPEERQRIEKKRKPSVERRVLATALWVAVIALLLGMAGITYLIEKRPPEFLPPLNLGPTPESLLMLMISGGLIYLSFGLQRYESWAANILQFGSPVFLLAAIAGMYFGLVPVHPVLIGILSVFALALLVLLPRENRKVFTTEYRELQRHFRQSIMSCLRNYVTWVPLLIMAIGLLISRTI